MTDEELQATHRRWEKAKSLRAPHSGAVRLPAPDVTLIDRLFDEVDRLRAELSAEQGKHSRGV